MSIKSIKKWVKEHKEELIAAGVSIGTIIFFYKFFVKKSLSTTIDLDMIPTDDGGQIVTMTETLKNGKVVNKLSRTLSKNDADSLCLYLLNNFCDLKKIENIRFF